MNKKNFWKWNLCLAAGVCLLGSAGTFEKNGMNLQMVAMADEMTEYSKYNILAQVGQAVLAQANESPEGVLNLLK